MVAKNSLFIDHPYNYDMFSYRNLHFYFFELWTYRSFWWLDIFTWMCHRNFKFSMSQNGLIPQPILFLGFCISGNGTTIHPHQPETWGLSHSINSSHIIEQIISILPTRYVSNLLVSLYPYCHHPSPSYKYLSADSAPNFDRIFWK